jgi:AraC-like DNA-binding protein
MDLHMSSSGDIPIEELIRKHKDDLAVQHKYGVKFKSMWVNKDKGMVFCLMEGPDKDACNNVHQEAHGDTGCNIIQVSEDEYNTFLGNSIPNENDIAETESRQMDTGYRTILHFEVIGSVHNHQQDYKSITDLIQKRFKGSLLLEPEKSIRAVFVRPVNALICAQHIRNQLNSQYKDLDFRMAIVAGKPVDEDKDQFYGYGINLGEKLLKSGHRGNIRTTQLTLELLYKEDANTDVSLNEVEVLSPGDESFLYQLITSIENNFTSPHFNATDLARESGLSRAQLFRKVKKLSGYTPNTLIREIRLYEAIKQLDKQTDQVAQVAYNTGFNSPSYFSKLFAQRFCLLPTEYIHGLDK